MSARVPVHISPYFEELHPRVRLVCVCLTSSVCSSVSRCVSTSLSLSFPLSLSVSLSLCVSGCLFVCLYLCLSVCRSLSVCLALSTCLTVSVCLSACLCVCLFACARASIRACAGVWVRVLVVRAPVSNIQDSSKDRGPSPVHRNIPKVQGGEAERVDRQESSEGGSRGVRRIGEVHACHWRVLRANGRRGAMQ